MRYATLEMKKINGIGGDSHQPSETGEAPIHREYAAILQGEIKVINHNLLLWCQGLGCTFVEQRAAAQHSEFSFCIWLVSRWHKPWVHRSGSLTLSTKSLVEKNKSAFIFSLLFDVNNVESTSRTSYNHTPGLVWIKFINESNPEMSDVFRMRGDAGYLFLHDHSRLHPDRKYGNTPRQKLWMFFTRIIIEWKKTWG